jgi:hypothetical protein
MMARIARRLTSDSIPIAWSSSRSWNSRKKAQKTQNKRSSRSGSRHQGALGLAAAWRGAALTPTPGTRRHLLYDLSGGSGCTAAAPGNVSAFCSSIESIEYRRWAKPPRWVVLGSRQLSCFPAATHYRARCCHLLSYSLKRLPSSRAWHPTLIPGLGLLRCQMLLEFLHLRVDHQLAVSLGRILREIVLMIVFCSIEML